jgi:hypothetical protein
VKRFRQLVVLTFNRNPRRTAKNRHPTSKFDRAEVPLTHCFSTNSRGIGVVDMTYAIRTGSPQRVSGDLAYHVVDIMQAIHEAEQQGQHIVLESTCERPSALPNGESEQSI